MEAIIVMISVAFIVAMISLIPKGSNHNKEMYQASLKDLKKIIKKGP